MQKGILIAAVIVIALVLGGVLFFLNKGNVGTEIPDSTSLVGNQGGVNYEPTDSGNTNSSSGQEASDSAQTYNVLIQGFEFKPSSLTINVGDSVVWTNKDSVQHTVTSDSGNELKSSSLSNGGSYSHTFLIPGTYPYHCAPHPYMKATITVQ